jgi:hypothetical protein
MQRSDESKAFPETHPFKVICGVVLSALPHQAYILISKPPLCLLFCLHIIVTNASQITKANLSEDSVDAEKMPYIMKLRSALYSSEFRCFVEKISNLEKGTLTEQVRRAEC